MEPYQLKTLTPKSLLARVRESSFISDHNYVADVSRDHITTLPASSKESVQSDERHTVVVYNFGVKKSILKSLQSGWSASVQVVPWDTAPRGCAGF